MVQHAQNLQPATKLFAATVIKVVQITLPVRVPGYHAHTGISMATKKCTEEACRRYVTAVFFKANEKVL